MKNIFTLPLVFVLFTNLVNAQEKLDISNDSIIKELIALKREMQLLKPSVAVNSSTVSPIEKKSNWYDKINIRGYVQVRYNRSFETALFKASFLSKGNRF